MLCVRCAHCYADASQWQAGEIQRPARRGLAARLPECEQETAGMESSEETNGNR